MERGIAATRPSQAARSAAKTPAIWVARAPMREPHVCAPAATQRSAATPYSASAERRAKASAQSSAARSSIAKMAARAGARRVMSFARPESSSGRDAEGRSLAGALLLVRDRDAPRRGVPGTRQGLSVGAEQLELDRVGAVL